MPKISKDMPLAELTLRRYERPSNLSKRELIRKLCLSIGLLQPGDSRDIIVDIFNVLIDSKKPLQSEEIQEKVVALRKKYKSPLIGIAHSNVRRQIKRLRELFLVEKIRNEYRITENDSLLSIYENKIEKYYLNSINERVKEYFKAIK